MFSFFLSYLFCKVTCYNNASVDEEVGANRRTDADGEVVRGLGSMERGELKDIRDGNTARDGMLHSIDFQPNRSLIFVF
jgi:hypothetical protein